MRYPFRVSFLVIAFVLAVSSATTVFAAPTGWQKIDVTLHSEQTGGVLLISGELPKTTELPAQAELAVPAGSQIQWIGEILGGDPSADPALKYTKSTVKDADIYRFTLTKARTAQVEIPTPKPLLFDGSTYTPFVSWVSSQDVSQVKLSVRMPRGAQVTQAAPEASTEPGPTGYSYYSKTINNVKAGDELDLTFAYAPPAAGTAPARVAPSGSTVGTVALVTGILAAALGVLLIKLKRSGSSPEVPPAATRTVPMRSGSTKTSSSKQSKNKKLSPVEEVAPPARKIKPTIPVLAVVGVFVAGALIAGNAGTSAKVVNGTIKKSFGATSPCTSASIPVMANEGVDLGSQGEKLVDAFVGQQGVGDVTLDIARSTVDITFCESSQSEAAVGQILSGTGLVTVGPATGTAASAPATASLDPSGKKQSASVDTANGAFTPGTVALKAGVPAELAFGAANSCITEVIFSELGIKQDLTAGPATVKLPALEAGTYAFACPMGHQAGQLVVQ
jgi:hypothetical protein